MKRCKDKLMLVGTRYFRDISVDEYEIIILIKDLDDKGIFMNEETFELIELTQEEVYDHYTQLSYSKGNMIASYTLIKTIDDKYSIYNTQSEQLQEIACIIGAVKEQYPFIVYRYMKKQVVKAILDNIISTNDIDDVHKNEWFEIVWEDYITTQTNTPQKIVKDKDKTEFIPTIRSKYKLTRVNNSNLTDYVLSPSVIDTINDYGIFMKTCSVFDYSPDVNIFAIQRKFFILYDEENDIYTIAIYRIRNIIVMEELDIIDDPDYVDAYNAMM